MSSTHSAAVSSNPFGEQRHAIDLQLAEAAGTDDRQGVLDRVLARVDARLDALAEGGSLKLEAQPAGKILGVSWGLAPLDAAFGPLAQKEQHVIGGLSEHGKTALAAQVAVAVAQTPLDALGVGEILGAVDGEHERELLVDQRRDFVAVGDVVRANLHFLDQSDRSGIFNLGSGRAQSFNDVAVASVNGARALKGEDALSLDAMVSQGLVEYVAFPEALKGKTDPLTNSPAYGFLDPLKYQWGGFGFYFLGDRATAYAKHPDDPAWLFDPDTMKPRVNNPAWVRATIGSARMLSNVPRLMLPAPGGTRKNWAVYRSRFIDPVRIAAGQRFWRDNADTLARAERDFGVPELVVFNAGYRARGPIAEIDPIEAEAALRNNALAGFLVGQGAARLMLGEGKGSIFFTGATAGIKGFAGSAPFAMGKFALRGLAQSMARELGPKGIHVAHFIIDGGIAGTRGSRAVNEDDVLLSPQAIAEAYLNVHKQHRSAWTHELDLRPWMEPW